MLTEEQEWSQRYAKQIEDSGDETDDDDQHLTLNNRIEDLGPTYKVKRVITLLLLSKTAYNVCLLLKKNFSAY